jgi:hypothetical protein
MGIDYRKERKRGNGFQVVAISIYDPVYHVVCVSG